METLTEYEKSTVNLLVDLFLGDVSTHNELIRRYCVTPTVLWMRLVSVAIKRAVLLKQYMQLEEALAEKHISEAEALIICQRIVVVE